MNKIDFFEHIFNGKQTSKIKLLSIHALIKIKHFLTDCKQLNFYKLL